MSSFSPMLASSGPVAAPASAWAFEPKLDGWRVGLTGPAWCTVLSVVGDGPELMAACGQFGLEGLVAKRLDSIYRPGELSKHWVNAKCPDWRAFHVRRRLSEGRRAVAK